MKNLIALLLTIGIVSCTEPPKPEKYGSTNWERIFLLDNRGMSLLCLNNDDTVSFLLISEKEDCNTMKMEINYQHTHSDILQSHSIYLKRELIVGTS